MDLLEGERERERALDGPVRGGERERELDGPVRRGETYRDRERRSSEIVRSSLGYS